MISLGLTSATTCDAGPPAAVMREELADLSDREIAELLRAGWLGDIAG